MKKRYYFISQLIKLKKKIKPILVPVNLQLFADSGEKTEKATPRKRKSKGKRDRYFKAGK